MPHSTRNYAQAFVQVFGHNYSVDSMRDLERAAHILQERKVAQLLSLPYRRDERIAQALYAFMGVQGFADPSWGMPALIDVVVERKRVPFFSRILLDSVRIWRAQHGIESCIVKTRHPWSEDMQQHLYAALSRAWRGTLEATWEQDASCLGGVCVTTPTRRWDATVKRYLQRAAEAEKAIEL